MDTSNMIDLGREYDSMPCAQPSEKKEKKTSYPSLYISQLEEMPDLPKGDFYILAKVCVARISIDAKNEDNSLELEVKEMKPVGEAPSEEDVDMEAEMESLMEEGSAGKLAKAMESYDEED